MGERRELPHRDRKSPEVIEYLRRNNSKVIFSVLFLLFYFFSPTLLFWLAANYKLIINKKMFNSS